MYISAETGRVAKPWLDFNCGTEPHYHCWGSRGRKSRMLENCGPSAQASTSVNMDFKNQTEVHRKFVMRSQMVSTVIRYYLGWRDSKSQCTWSGVDQGDSRHVCCAARPYDKWWHLSLAELCSGMGALWGRRLWNWSENHMPLWFQWEILPTAWLKAAMCHSGWSQFKDVSTVEALHRQMKRRRAFIGRVSCQPYPT